MSTGPSHRTQRLGGKPHENVREYMVGLMAAIRTHQRLTSGAELFVEVQEDGKIPLAQRALLR